MAGFETGIGKSSGADIVGNVACHAGDSDSVMDATRERLSAGTPATAILAGTALSFATLTTYLMKQGLRIPDDVSLISRE